MICEEEVWEYIPGYEGLYQVSNMGRARSVYHEDGFGRKFCGRMLKPIDAGNGYLRLHLSKGSKRELVSLHRLVAMLFVPNPLGHPIINHKDENPRNNRSDNLEWCTQKYNINYGSRSRRSGEKHRGERCVFSKLSECDVYEIKKAFLNGKNKSLYYSLAEKYNVSVQNIRSIAAGRCWGWLELKEECK